MEYSDKPKWWWQDEELHSKYKEEAKKLKNKYKALFAEKHGKKKDKKKSESESSSSSESES